MMLFDIPPEPWDELQLWHIADAILCSPDSHPDIFRKRIAMLRAQGEDDFAAFVENTVDLSVEAVEIHERRSRMIERIFNRLGLDEPGRQAP